MANNSRSKYKVGQRVEYTFPHGRHPPYKQGDIKRGRIDHVWDIGTPRDIMYRVKWDDGTKTHAVDKDLQPVAQGTAAEQEKSP